MKNEYTTNSSSQTKKLAEILAKKIIKNALKKKNAQIIGLEGNLGGGKTTFLQGFARGLGIQEKILSPTFVLMKKFKILTTNYQLQYTNFYHIDCYRVKKAREILDLDFKKIVSNPKNIIAVEWANRIRRIMPKDTIWIKFMFAKKNKRKITLPVR